jgi:16S rRNA G966 N2-methylase RsmD
MISSQWQVKGALYQEYANPMAVFVSNLMEEVRSIPYNREAIPQESLDLANKFRTSLFPWRGQFSPELVEILLNQYSNGDSIILDPFVGSGTTLFEASRKELECYGAEINPSAIEMAKTVQFAVYPLAERKRLIHRARIQVEKSFRPFIRDLFSYQDCEQPGEQERTDNSWEVSLKTMLKEVQDEPLVHNILVNALIRYMNYRPSRQQADLFHALWEHAKIIESMPYTQRECRVFHTDARSIPLPDKSIDLVITSPPYINVFNYHQNNRAAMELVGWNLLEIARSEIGSNRKNRQNRFLTVIQYALDMLDMLQEIQRLLRLDGRAIIVVGRESNVRGISFKNGRLVAALASGGSGFRLDMLQERKFINKFGEMIYEDILHLVPDCEKKILDHSFARFVAVWSLLEAAKIANEQVIDEILEAIERADMVQKSPYYQPEVASGHDL